MVGAFSGIEICKSAFSTVASMVISLCIAAAAEKASPGIDSIKAENARPNTLFEFSGFVKTDIFYDTRQMAGAREGALVLYPKPVDLDDHGKDVNAYPSMNLLSIHTRLAIATPSLTIRNANVQGFIEADFMGNENANFADLNGLRLRHAYGKIAWSNTELLFGQYWHPFFFVQSCPRVIAINTGAPFQPLSRNPQLRITHKIGHYSVVGAIFSQQDFASQGPDGQSPKYLRNAGLPNLHIQIQRNDSTAAFFGIGADYKMIRPEEFSIDAETGARFKSTARLKSFSLMGVVQLDFRPISLRSAALYAQNPYDILMIGGYAVASDPAMGRRSFSNQQTASAWVDVQSKGNRFLWGTFLGLTRNLGAGQPITDEQYSRGANIAYVYRMAPRAQYRLNRLWCSLEYERTTVAYGEPNADGWGNVAAIGEVTNSRLLLSFRYNF